MQNPTKERTRKNKKLLLLQHQKLSGLSTRTRRRKWEDNKHERKKKRREWVANQATQKKKII
jgi:hypothetical protein